MKSVRNHIEVRERARRRLPRPLFDYVDGGADEEVTRGRNRAAFDRVEFRPRMGEWIAVPSLQTTLFGDSIAWPVLTAPCGGMRLVHPDGDRGVARAAAAVGTMAVVSAAGGHSMEDVAAETGAKWFQVYRMSGRSMMEGFVHRAAAAGYRALVVTIDTPVNGNRERDKRHGFSIALKADVRTAARLAPHAIRRPGWATRFVRSGMPIGMANTAASTADNRPLPVSEMTRVRAESMSPTWEDIAWIRENWTGPLVIKGVLTGEDARRSLDAGAQEVVVSNHGGRQLDGAPASFAVLAEVVAAVDGQAAVLLDSGVRRGTDVVKALCVGADAVLVGRLVAWGLAVGGEAGVRGVLEMLRDEIVRTMQLLGCADVADLDASWVRATDLARDRGTVEIDR